jgi:hypothetical protein
MNRSWKGGRRVAEAGTLIVGLLLIAGAAVCVPQHGERNQSWKVRSFLDFSEGSVADGGANTYVAADGSVRLINARSC